MFHKLLPDKIVESIYDVDLEELKEIEIKAVIADLDNTLVPWGTSQIDETLEKWVVNLREAGLELAIVSNNSLARVREMSEKLGVLAVSNAVKPRRRGFRSIARQLGLVPQQVAVVGDQLFTDVLGGNRTGMYTILVTPISSREFIGTRFIRFWERFFLKRIKKRGK